LGKSGFRALEKIVALLYFSNYLCQTHFKVFCARFARKMRGMWFIFGQSPKSEPPLLFSASEASRINYFLACTKIVGYSRIPPQYFNKKIIFLIKKQNKMTSENPTQLTEQELMAEEKKLKSRLTAVRVITGFFIVAAIYGAVKKNFSSSTAIPLLAFGPYLMQIEKKYKAVKMEIQSRKAQ
jgi:hypothetical protein